jgi:hypothetical protein
MQHTAATLLAAMAVSFALPSCSEKARVSARVIKEKAEDKLVEQAGEAEVAIGLMQNQYAELKERLVRIKTLIRSFERRATELDARAGELAASGKAEQAERQKRMAESYRQKRERLLEKDAEVTEELKNFAVLYEETKADLMMLKEEIEMAKSVGGLDPDLGIESPLVTRMSEVRKLTEKLRVNLDRAESLIEIGDIEKDL